MKKTIVSIVFVAFLGCANTANAHLITKPKNKTAKAILVSQTKNLAHVKYVCNNGKRSTKSWHCEWVKPLNRERGETLKILYPPVYVAPYPWYQIALCESSLGTGAPIWNINTGNGYYGGLQFDYGTWHEAQDNLGVYYSEYAHQATPAQQVTAARTLPLTRWPICGAPYR